MANDRPDEQEPLLDAQSANGTSLDTRQRARATAATGGVFIFILVVILVVVFVGDGISRDPYKVALDVLGKAPVIDGHIDLPILVRAFYSNNVSALDLNSNMPGHVDIPRLRAGRVGAFFWSVFTPCEASGEDFTQPTNSVRDTLEQIDVAVAMIERYRKTFALATSAEQIREVIRGHRIASLLGVEGAHQLGNSLGALRALKRLGVKYVTLTHVCHNAFADSAGIGPYLPPRHHGLSPFGRVLIRELNRLGILVDLSHTSDDTARQALEVSVAPVIWSHSSARAVRNHPRNVPDDILKMIGQGSGKTDAVVMVNFAPDFISAEGNATVQVVADHVDHIARVAGMSHVGIGSDFDGIETTPAGLEDVSKYPQLFAELRSRGWTRRQLAGLAGVNVLRILEKAEAVAQELQNGGAQVSYDFYSKRPDLPVRRRLSNVGL